MLTQTQPTRQFVGPSVLGTMHARHAGICDSCGQRVETFGQSWQLERRSRWSRAHLIESCMREVVETAKATYYHHNAEIQYMTLIRAACWCLKRVNALEKHWWWGHVTWHSRLPSPKASMLVIGYLNAEKGRVKQMNSHFMRIYNDSVCHQLGKEIEALWTLVDFFPKTNFYYHIIIKTLRPVWNSMYKQTG